MEFTLVFLMSLLVTWYSHAGALLEKNDHLHIRTRRQEPLECRITQLGEEYMGTERTTKSGIECTPWVSHIRPAYNDSWFPDGSAEAASNYCRNPGGEEDGPFCHIGAGHEWESCDIPFCESSSSESSSSESSSSEEQ